MKKLKKNKQGVSNKNMISMITIGKYQKDKDDMIKHTSKLSANCFVWSYCGSVIRRTIIRPLLLVMISAIRESFSI